MVADRLPSLDRIDPAQCWQTWTPDAKDPFDLKWAGHLYRRAAFGGTLTELRDARKRGLKATLDLLLNGQENAEGLVSFLNDEGAKIARRHNIVELRGWWLYLMLNSGHPLREKLTLFWHNHFVSSVTKVDSTTALFQQNKLMRTHALGKFGPFLQEVSKDPAMLLYLDSNSNVAGKPNENYAREVMELFSLGVGHYTEKDIREAARAFTGWHTDGDVYEFNPRFHDNGEKTVLGVSGKLNGDDVVRICLGRKDCAEFLVGKFYRHYVSETPPPRTVLQPLADQFRKSDYDVAALMRTILSSRLFFSEHAFRQRIKSPVEYVLGAVRSVVEGTLPQQALINRLDAMGQPLFAPPNVKGWPGGRTWLNTSTMLARSNFAQALAMGKLWKEIPRRALNRFEEIQEAEREEAERRAQEAEDAAEAARAKKEGREPKKRVKPSLPEEAVPPKGFDPARPLQTEKPVGAEAIVDLLLDVHLPGGVDPDARRQLIAFVEEDKPSGAALERRVREAVHAIVSMAEYQLA
jgi:uncharacterized protein (DUF1800 family)